MKTLLLTAVAACALFIQCSKDERPLFELLPSEQTGIDFSNMLYESSDLNIFTYEYFFNGAGLGIADINNDGLQDVYFSGNMVSGKLYLNKGDFRFEDITESAGISTANKWGTGVSIVDINADGWQDIYLCFSGPYRGEARRNMLYINNRNNTFTERAEEYGLDDAGPQNAAAFFDYDKDGDLDVYFLNNLSEETGPNVLQKRKVNGESPSTDKLFRNDEGKFTDVSKQAGILSEGYGLGLAVADLNNDGWEDIYVSNDFVTNDLLYLNQHDGTFLERAADSFGHTSYSSMGCDVSDFNNDGLQDILAVDMLPPDNLRQKLMIGSINNDRYLSELRSGYMPQFTRNVLQVNRGTVKNLPIFSEVGQLAGVQATDWSWSPLFFDVDNDGLQDLAITNGYPRDNLNLDFISYKANLMTRGNDHQKVLLEKLNEYVGKLDGIYLPNEIYQNNGAYVFTDRSKDWGFVHPSFSHAAAYADLDNDGDLDYVTNNSYDKAFIYRNRARQQTAESHFVRVSLEGKGQNRLGLGAKVTVYTGAGQQSKQLSPYRGFQSSVEPLLHFGLGTQESIDSIEVFWPTGGRTCVFGPEADHLLTISENNVSAMPIVEQNNPFFVENTPFSDAAFTHTDPHFSEFKFMSLLPHKYSDHGPYICTGDLNNDGLEDFFVGGAFRQSGQVFIQDKSGLFAGKELDRESAHCEDLGSAFLDYDSDGDLDLYVASGSNEFAAGSKYYEDRLYENDGHGRFVRSAWPIPNIRTSTSAVVSMDFNQDGREDIFVAGYVDFEHYPQNPRSYLLENTGKGFKEVAAERAPELQYFGMIKDAVWADMDGNSWPDLVLAAEWRPITVFYNDNGHFRKQELPKTCGWWNSVIAADLDNDGDLDIAGGNLGLNNPYTHSPGPLSRFVADFDQNGRLDPIMVEGGIDVVHYRDDLLYWIEPLKKRFTSYESYAKQKWEGLFTGSRPLRIDIDLFESCWFENKGETPVFETHRFPVEAQFSTIYGILPNDFDQDGLLDLLLVGNALGADSQNGRYDASQGLMLKGGNPYRTLDFKTTGFYVPGQSRDIALIEKGQQIIIVRNNDSLLAFRFGETAGMTPVVASRNK